MPTVGDVANALGEIGIDPAGLSGSPDSPAPTGPAADAEAENINPVLAAAAQSRAQEQEAIAISLSAFSAAQQEAAEFNDSFLGNIANFFGVSKQSPTSHPGVVNTVLEINPVNAAIGAFGGPVAGFLASALNVGGLLGIDSVQINLGERGAGSPEGDAAPPDGPESAAKQQQPAEQPQSAADRLLDLSGPAELREKFVPFKFREMPRIKLPTIEEAFDGTS